MVKRPARAADAAIYSPKVMVNIATILSTPTKMNSATVASSD